MVSNDLSDDPQLKPWFALAQEHGVKACAALPIVRADIPVGVLVVYAGVPGFFKQREMRLLSKWPPMCPWAWSACACSLREIRPSAALGKSDVSQTR